LEIERKEKNWLLDAIRTELNGNHSDVVWTIINRAQFKQNLGTTISGIFCFSRIELSIQIYEPGN
jgi:hypothetical protein